MAEPEKISWSEDDLRVGVLQVLLAARKRKPRFGGSSGKGLMEILGVDNVRELEGALWYLRERNFIETSERVFLITAAGVDYLEERFPPEPPDSSGNPPDKPSGGPLGPWGPWPPKKDPDDPSRVPRRPLPAAGAGEIALPLPDVQEEPFTK